MMTKEEVIRICKDDFYRTGASVDTQEKCWKILTNLLADPMFASDGRRNNDAVNACIALHVLGYDAKDAIEHIMEEWTDNEFRIKRFMEHVERVYPYLEFWGRSSTGHEYEALEYLV